jgi:uncharacterized protein (DUF2141 family)
MKKIIFLIIIIFFYVNTIFADVIFTVEIHNVTVNGGTIFLGFYSNEYSFRNENPDITLQIEPISTIIIQEIILPEGEYVIGVHQDTNGNGVMDYGLFGIPREPFGFSNMRGRIPGNFDQLKVNINNRSNRIIIPLVRF